MVRTSKQFIQYAHFACKIGVPRLNHRLSISSSSIGLACLLCGPAGRQLLGGPGVIMGHTSSALLKPRLPRCRSRGKARRVRALSARRLSARAGRPVSRTRQESLASSPWGSSLEPCPVLGASVRVGGGIRAEPCRPLPRIAIPFASAVWAHRSLSVKRRPI